MARIWGAPYSASLILQDDRVISENEVVELSRRTEVPPDEVALLGFRDVLVTHDVNSPLGITYLVSSPGS